MSATRDKSQKVAFVYSNLYSIYRKGVERARDGAVRESTSQSPSRAAEALHELATGRLSQGGAVIKAGDLSVAQAAASSSVPRVTPYTPAELIGKRVARPASISNSKPAAAQNQGTTPDAVQSLKKNLESLNDLQARLRFMLKELEELIKD